MKSKKAKQLKYKRMIKAQCSSIKHKTLNFGVKHLLNTLNLLTRKQRKKTLKHIGKTIFFFAKRTKKRAINNITQAMPELSIKEATDLAFEAYGNCAFGVTESFWLSQIEPDIFCDEDTLRILQSGQGACIATMHLGCYEAVPLAIAKFAKQSVTLTNIPNFLDNAQDFYSAANIIAIDKKSTNAFSDLLEYASGNAYISLHCDLYANQTNVTFFGQKTKAPAGIVLLAKMAKKPLLLAYAVYQDNGQVQVFFETLYKNKPYENTEQTLSLNVEQIMTKIYQRFEEIIKQYPSQWYWSYNRWKNYS
jgi:KDO2-lipid IV(A) lauroyltransferase